MPFTFEPLDLPGVMRIQPGIMPDDRGFFMEAFRRSQFAEAGITEPFLQSNMSYSTKGVLRGIHYQIGPMAQGKLVRVFEGAVFDVVVDVRPDSPTHGQWVSIELSADNRTALWVPPGYGHAFVVLSDTARVYYDVTQEFHPQSERGILWNDPALAIPWPVANPVLSPKDESWPVLADATE